MKCHERNRLELPASAIFLTLLFACEGNDLPTMPSSPSAPASTNQTDDPNVPNAQIQGTYSVTFTAAPDCILPEEVRSRTYAATVTQTPSSPGDVVEVVFSGANFYRDPVRGVLNHVAGTVLDSHVTFRFGDRGIAEEVSPGLLLVIGGQSSGSADSSSITGVLRGDFTYGEDPWGDHDPFGHVGCTGGSVLFTRQ